MKQMTDDEVPDDQSTDREPAFLTGFSIEEVRNLGFQVDQLISKRDHPLHFASPLEEIYLNQTYLNSHQRMLIGGLVSLFIYDLFLLVDYSILTDVFNIALVVRLGIFTPLVLLTLLNLKRQFPFWNGDLLKFLITLGAGISFIYLAHISTSHDAVFYFPALILVIVFGNIYFRLQFLYACVLSAAIFLLFAFFFPMDPHLPPQVYQANMLFLITSIGITLFANQILDREQRHSFLLSMRERIRKKVLLDKNIYLSRLSTIDPLTGLANRREVDSYLANLNQIWPEILSIIMLDIDFFKQFNDVYGHAAGDDCLRQIAVIIMNSVHRKRDMTGRFGGEEFIIILPETELVDSEKIAENILKGLADANIIHSGSTISSMVTLSAGTACGEIAGSGNVFTVLKAADEALYKAKSSGRNRIQSTQV